MSDHKEYDKSTWIPINVRPQRIPVISGIMGCKRSDFPITYLGLPLTIKKPHRSLYMPLIQKLEAQLEGWKSKLLSRGGRLELMNSVLSSIPIYFMASFLIPQWVVHRLDQIRRGFLWSKTDSRRGISLINWETVCFPKQNGGMGGVDLKFRNYSLLIRWWWRLYRNSDSLWTGTIIQLRCVSAAGQGPKVWSPQGSFFWKQLWKLRTIFLCSVRWRVGTGTIVSYWFDTWRYPTVATEAQEADEGITNRFRSLRDATLADAPYTQDIILNEQVDEMYWLWTNNGFYSAKSLYDIMITGDKEGWKYKYIWRLKIPPTVRIFVYLWLKGKLLTHDIMWQRGITCDLSCATCANGTSEMAMHLFFQCSYAVVFWTRVNLVIGQRIMLQGNSIQLTFDRLWRNCRGSLRRTAWSTYFIAACWFLRKERNNQIFNRKLRDPRWVAERAIEEGRLWMAHC